MLAFGLLTNNLRGTTCVSAAIAALVVWSALIARDSPVTRAKSPTRRRATLRSNLMVPRRHDRAPARLSPVASCRMEPLV